MKAKFLVLIFALFFIGQAFAQREMKSPEETAKNMTERMKEKLQLSEDQNNKVYQINLKVAQERKSRMEAAQASGTRPSKEDRAKSMKEYDGQIVAVLNPEQQATWNEVKQEFQEKAKSKKASRSSAQE